jgi:hypothetical protein
MKGGTPYSNVSSSGGAPYSSASTYGTYINGSGDAQFNRVFDQTGKYADIQGNSMIGAQGQRAGGRRKRTNSKRTNSRRTKTRRGGNALAAALATGLPPLTLLAMQQKYKRGSISALKSKFNLPRFSKQSNNNNNSRRFSRRTFRA